MTPRRTTFVGGLRLGPLQAGQVHAVSPVRLAWLGDGADAPMLAAPTTRRRADIDDPGEPDLHVPISER